MLNINQFLKYLVITIIFLGFYHLTIAQSTQCRTWIIPDETRGANDLLRFSSGAPNLSNISTNVNPPVKSCNAMQDVHGNLLFYVVDGIIYDSQSNEIDNIYNTIICDVNSSCTQQSFDVVGTPEVCIVPVPGSCTRYFIITGSPAHCNYTGAMTYITGLVPVYVILDMSLPNLNSPYPSVQVHIA